MKGRRPEEYEGLVRTVLLMLMLVSAYFIVRGGARFVSSPQVETKRERPCVIIDAGHGGVDPGKVSVDGALEKDINLDRKSTRLSCSVSCSSRMWTRC